MLFLCVMAPSHSAAGCYQDWEKNTVSIFSIEWLPIQQTAAQCCNPDDHKMDFHCCQNPNL